MMDRLGTAGDTDQQYEQTAKQNVSHSFVSGNSLLHISKPDPNRSTYKATI
jgi:hypothetical protein